MAPKQKPGRSKQDYRTPPEFLQALRQYLSIKDFTIDLAADHENAITTPYYTEEQNSLVQSWNYGPWAFCNPPYANIEPWVIKAVEETIRGAYVAMLLPASVGSNWWRDYVDGIAYVVYLNGRLNFMPDKPTWLYPKDCAVLLYTPWLRGGSTTWNWRQQ